MVDGDKLPTFVEKDPVDEHIELLKAAGDDWQSAAVEMLKLTEGSGGVMSPRNAAANDFIGGTLLFLQEKYGADNDEEVLGAALMVIDEAIPYNQGQLAIILGMELAGSDRLDAADALANSKGLENNKDRFLIKTAIALNFARRGDRDMALAFMQEAHHVTGRCDDTLHHDFADVFKALDEFKEDRQEQQ